MNKVTSLAQHRAIVQRPASNLCRWSSALEQIAIGNIRIAAAWHRGWLRLMFGALLVVGLSGCVTLDGVGGQITAAQAEYLKARAVMEADKLHYQAGIAREMARIAERSTDPIVHAWALSSIERMTGPKPGTSQTAAIPAQQDGPITSALKAVAPYVLPIAQLWVQREQGRDQLRFQRQQLTTSVEMESLRLGLIDSITGRISRDPLVVETPPPQIIPTPDPVIIPAPDPVIIHVPTGG